MVHNESVQEPYFPEGTLPERHDCQSDSRSGYSRGPVQGVYCCAERIDWIEGTLKLYEKEEQLAQKFASFFPEQTSEQDRVAAFLSQDVTAIRQDYIQTFSPPPDPRKKKRSRRERE